VGRRVRRPEPRAHWALLAVALFAVLAGLCLHGYVIGAGAGTDAPAADPRAAPGSVTGGAAVQRYGPAGCRPAPSR
jgi:hypothetical protein